jgi:hypothetical protein
MARKKTSVFFCRDTRQFANLSKGDLELLVETYPEINVVAELRFMRAWLLDPKNEKYVGNLAFIRSWLRKAKPPIKLPQTIDEFIDFEKLQNDGKLPNFGDINGRFDNTFIP